MKLKRVQNYSNRQALVKICFIAIVLLFILETLIAFLQAYVFAVLTCLYLSDSFHPEH